MLTMFRKCLVKSVEIRKTNNHEQHIKGVWHKSKQINFFCSFNFSPILSISAIVTA